MKKVILTILLALLIVGLKAQPVVLRTENFDGSITGFTYAPASRWVLDSSFKTSSPYSMHGLVPSHLGDSAELISPWINAKSFSNLLLSFKHICKISESDIVTIEYQINQIGAPWKRIPMSSYQGPLVQYKNQKFSQKSYADWIPNDSLAIPTNLWWKTETFDLSAEAGWEEFRIKFKIKRGTTVGTQFAYGWLIDDLQILAANAQIKLPVVEFMSPFIPDTVYSTGPYVINAKVATRTMAPIIHPKLQLSYTLNGITTYDSITMIDINGGDSLWTATIPQKRFGNLVNYSILGRDTGGNALTIASSYYIKRLIPDSTGTQGIVEVYTGTRNGGSYVMPFDITYVANWTRQIYPSAEFNGRSGMITKIGWAGYFDSYTGVAERKNVSIYFEEVNYTALSNTAYINPNNLTNATLVYSGDITLLNGYRPWNDVMLQTPFLLSPGKNLLVHVYDNTGYTCNGVNSSGTSYYAFTYKATNFNSGVYCRSANGTGTLNTYGTHTRFTMAGGTADSNAVALFLIEAPTKSVIAGQNTNVKVTIVNNGYKDLTSCVINWKLNGVLQTPYYWTGNLPDDFKDTGIVIGSYVPRNSLYDSIVIWVGMPNAVLDSVNVHDDTLSITTYGCTSKMQGDYVIGNQAGADFATYAAAIQILENCGASGNITFKFQTGTYTPHTIGDLSKYLGSYTLTITSLTGNANDVKFQRNSGTFAINISGAQNIIIKNVSIINPLTSTTAATYALLFTGNNTNIDVINCNILMDTTVTSSYFYVVYKTSTGVLNNVRLINNVIRGGYYGVYVYGGTATSNYGKNLVIDSNLIFGQYYYATYLYYCDFNSISYNTILSRMANVGSNWYGFRTYYCNMNAIGNKIRQRSNSITTPYLAYIYYASYYNAIGRSLFSNNEIIGYTTGSYYGMYIYYCAMDVYHNSILLRGTTSSSRCMYIGGTTAYITDCKNNNILNYSTGGYPIYIASTGVYTGDYNNLYSKSTYVGYYSGNRTSLADWQTACGQDANSVRLQPIFLGDSSLSLKLLDYTGLTCPVLSNVMQDIEGVVRAGNTGMGAYTIFPTQLNAAALSAANWDSSIVLGNTAPVNVIIANMGLDSLVSVNVNWSFNGVTQTPIAWTGLLRTYEKDTVYLGVVYPITGLNTFKAWTSAPNNGIDDNTYNDSCVFKIYGCDSLYRGNYTVGGVGADFADMETALSSINNCGLAGPTVLLLSNGIYSGMVFKNNIKGMNGVNTLTITSQSGNPDDVRFEVSTGIALALDNVSNYYFKNVTFDASNASDGQGVNMKGRCVNIEFRNCKILASPTTSSSTHYAFYKMSGSVCDSIRLIGNLISGGYYGLYFYGSGTGIGGYNTNIYIDSNIIEKAYYYSHYFYYTDLNSFSANKIYPRSGNTYHYMYFYYTNHYHTVGNTWNMANTNIEYGYNYFYYSQYYNYTANGLIANNEFIHSASAIGGYGMYLGYTNGMVKVYNNSMFVPGTSSYGIYAYCSTGTGTFEVMNNNIWANYYPIYKTGTNVTFISDYNNLYSTGAYVGYYTSACTNLTTWATQSGDVTSVKVAPLFLDSTESLELTSGTGLACPQLQGVMTDILGTTRNFTTTMGCYEFDPKSYDVSPRAITAPTGTLITGTSTQTAVTVRNQGTVTITSMDINWSINGVAQPKYVWTGSLSNLGIANITIGSFIPATGTNIIKIWTDSLNGQLDERPSNDTILASFTACDSLLTGTYTLGNGGTFANMNALTAAISGCGIGGPVIIQMLPGKYSEMIFNGVIPGTDSINTITFTSFHSNADSVIIESTTGTEPTVYLAGGAANLIFDKLTINGCMNTGASISAGVGLYGCDNIIVRNCKINAQVDDTKYGEYSGIYSPYSGGQFGKVVIDNNLIRGTQYGTYLEPSRISGPIYLRNNTIISRYVGISSYGMTIHPEISYNTITFDTTSIRDYFYMFEAYGTYGSDPDTIWMVGNKFKVNANNSASTFYSYCYFSDFYPADALIMANNEFYVPYKSNLGYAYLEFYYCDNIHFINNSFLSYLNSAYINLDYGSGKLVMKNNNLVNLAGGDLLTFNGRTVTESDYNNVYSSGLSLSSWKSATAQDTHSVSMSPYFLNPSVNLNLLDDGGLECPRDTLVMRDIDSTLRNSLTSMGAYQVTSVNNNITPRTLVSPAAVSITGNSTPVTVTILNAGLNTITSMNVHWIVNGVVRTTYPWTGTLASKASVNVNLGSFIPLADSNMIIVYTSMPNGMTDAVPMNDTLRYYTKGCDSLLHGTYIVNNDNQLNNIIDKLFNCGVNGPVVVKLASGTYSPIDLTKAFIGTSTTNTVTFTSLAGNPDSVSITTLSSTTSALTLNNLHFVAFDKLTFNGTTVDVYVVKFLGSCSNLDFYGCKILANPNTTNSQSAAVYKTSGTGMLTNVRFIKNVVDGGYYGFYIYTGNGTGTGVGKNIVVDSNLIQNAYYYNSYFYYTEFFSYSYNTILSRTTNTTTYWYAMMSYYCNYKIANANKIRQRTTAITSPYGIYAYYSNYSSYTSDTGVFINNEVVLTSTGTYYGMYLPYSTLKVYNNSVLMQGSGASRALYLAGTDPIDIRNNIFVTPSGGHPIYMGTPAQPIYSDYNNLYGGGSYVGYNNANIGSLAAWRTATGQDMHSVSFNPPFIKVDSAYLSLTSSAGMYCPIVSPANMDIRGAGRYGLTAMGAYTNLPVTLDAAMVDVVDWGVSSVIGATTPVKAVLMNLSSANTLTSVTINWSVRGIVQTAYNWTGSLPQYASDTITLGNFYPIAGANNVVVWCSNPNYGLDLEKANDTIRVSTYGCDSLLHGIYTIAGVGASFASVADAVMALEKCGIDGPTEFRLASGTYGQLALSSSILGTSAVNTITFTSVSGDSSSVVFTGSPALNLTGISHVKFRYLTFGNGTGTYGVNMTGKCNNLEFYHCAIQLSTTATTSNTYAFYKPQGASCDNFRFIGNLVNGGYYGFYFYGQGTGVGGYNTNITVDSNQFTNAYYYPHYFYYTDLTSFSYNTITPRVNGYTYWYGYFYYTNHNYTVGNKWNTMNNTTINYFYNYMYYSHMYNYTGKGFYANNEIINRSNTGGYGLYVYGGSVDIYHNSFYTTAGSAYSLYIQGYSGQVECKNNQFLSMNIPVMAYQGNSITFDYNNYYSTGGIVGAMDGTSYFTMNDWVSKCGDLHAISIAPVYIDSTKSLQFLNYTGMACPRLASVNTDINNLARSSVTTMGAYSVPVFEGYNLSVAEITEPVLNTVVKCYPDFSTIKATLYNGGTLPIDFSVDSATLHVNVTGAMNFQMDTVISLGTLEAMRKDTIIITHFMPTSATGSYDIAVWVTCALDTMHTDDTAYSNYLVERVTLPYDVYFDTVPGEMAFQQIQGKVGFEVVDSVGAVLPPNFGTGRLAFKSSTGLGSMARVFIKQVDLQGTSKPMLNFWYQHDNANPAKPDQIDIIVSTDGGTSFTYLYTVSRYDVNATIPYWQMHQVDLSSYIQATCLIVGFEAQSYGGGDQFLDRVFLEVQQDLVPTEIRLPSDLYACDLVNKPIEVIVANTTVYAVEMSKDTINLTVEITTPDSNTQISTYRFLGKIPPLSSDTILVHAGFDFSQHGAYVITAYIDTIKITTDVSNDTITRTINVFPDVSVKRIENMGDKNIGDSVYAKATIINTGNLMIPQTTLRLQINNANDIVEILPNVLMPGDSVDYTFNQAYVVPIVSSTQPYYQVSVQAELDCDGDSTNNKVKLIAGVNIVDMAILSIVNPVATPCDTGLFDVFVKVQMYNNGSADLTNVQVNARIDSANMPVATVSDVFATVPMGTQEYTFTTPYQVPNLDGPYTLTVYIEKVHGEMDVTNDTISMEACAIKNTIGISMRESFNWSVGQNVPNPTQTRTNIPYYIPEPGQISLKIISISGQELLIETIEALAGHHQIELNTEQLSDGIYYYSIDYQGQRLVKKMTVQK